MSGGILTSATKIYGGDGNNTLDVSATASTTGLTFRVTEENGFDVKKGSTVHVKVSKVQGITGTTADDTFLFENNRILTGVIDAAGGGQDKIDLHSYKNSLTFDIKDADPQITVMAGTTVARAKNVEQLIGGKEADTFTFNDEANQWGGTGYVVDGRGKLDTVDFSSYTTHVVEVDLGATNGIKRGVATKTVSPLNVENVTGGEKDDILTGDDNANVLSGGKGNDTLNGGKGNDTLKGARETTH